MKRYLPLVCVGLTLCRSQSPTLPSREIATISPTIGAVSAKEIPDASAPEVELGPGEEFVRPMLRPENRHPEYPPELLHLALTPHVVVVRAIFNESGRVTEIVNSPLGASTEDVYRPQFEAAVRRAVEQWKCQAPRIRKFRPGPDADHDGKPDYRVLSAERILKAFFDLEFSFEVINGQPVVKRATPK